MAKISACVISYNEEAKIEDCLISLAGVADEIVVVDSNSTDRTVDIARKYTDKVILQEFLGYVAQKNCATDAASHDWVLVVDCDERLSPELSAEIEAEKPSLGRVLGYTVPRRTHYVDRWIDHAWYPDRGLRLFDRRSGTFVGGAVHEGIQLEEGPTADFKGDLLHYTCDSVSQHLDTIDRFSELAARDMFAKGQRTTVLGPPVRGVAMFLKLYVMKRGFLDGFSGFVVSVLSGGEAFVRYTKLWYMQRAGPPPAAAKPEST